MVNGLVILDKQHTRCVNTLIRPVWNKTYVTNVERIRILYFIKMQHEMQTCDITTGTMHLTVWRKISSYWICNNGKELDHSHLDIGNIGWSSSVVFMANKIYDDVIQWKRFSYYSAFVKGIPRRIINHPHKVSVWRIFDIFFVVSLNQLSNSCQVAGDVRHQYFPLRGPFY